MPRRTREWNVDNNLYIEVALDESGGDAPYDVTNDKPLVGLEELTPILHKIGGDGELVITFNSKGFNEPKSMYGGPDNLGWPEEGNDERTLVSVTLGTLGHKIKLPQHLQEAIFDIYEDQIYAKELEGDEPEGPERDRYDESTIKGKNVIVESIARFLTEDPNIIDDDPEQPSNGRDFVDQDDSHLMKSKRGRDWAELDDAVMAGSPSRELSLQVESLNYLRVAPDIDGGKIIALLRQDTNGEERELTPEEYVVLDLDPNSENYGYVDEHPEGAGRGGYVPTLESGNYYDENTGEWM